MKYLFGPVNSRRFGVSLGIDLSPDNKSCNFDCLYCELEKSTPVDKIKNEPQVVDIINELKLFLKEHKNIDVITITANGEPTLYSKLNKLIDEINKIKGNIKTLILSNGSTIYKDEIKNSLKKLDIVKLSLDSASLDTFKKIDKPSSPINLNKIIQGMIDFRKEYSGFFVIEVLVVEHVNDSEENIKKLAKILKEINPDRIDLGTVDRPPAYRVKPVSNKKLFELAEYFKGLNVMVITRKNTTSPNFSLNEEDILKTLSTRPFSEFDIETLFDKKTKEKFNRLLNTGKISKKRVGNHYFYSAVKL